LVNQDGLIFSPRDEKIGNSSFTLYQIFFQNGICVADATTVIVQVDETTGKSAPLSEETTATFEKWILEF
jgi:acyl-CoA thioester hydrolase